MEFHYNQFQECEILNAIIIKYCLFSRRIDSCSVWKLEHDDQSLAALRTGEVISGVKAREQKRKREQTHKEATDRQLEVSKGSKVFIRS